MFLPPFLNAEFKVADELGLEIVEFCQVDRFTMRTYIAESFVCFRIECTPAYAESGAVACRRDFVGGQCGQYSKFHRVCAVYEIPESSSDVYLVQLVWSYPGLFRQFCDPYSYCAFRKLYLTHVFLRYD